MIPILVCLMRFKELGSTYRLMLYPYITTLIGQIIYANFKFSPFGSNIFNYIVDVFWSIPLLYIVIYWTGIKKKINSLQFTLQFIFY